MDWYNIVGYLIATLCVFAAHRMGYVKGKRDGKFKWRCPECRSLLIADTPQEILHGSVDHMKEHLDGAISPPEEGS